MQAYSLHPELRAARQKQASIYAGVMRRGTTVALLLFTEEYSVALLVLLATLACMALASGQSTAPGSDPALSAETADCLNL